MVVPCKEGEIEARQGHAAAETWGSIRSRLGGRLCGPPCLPLPWNFSNSIFLQKWVFGDVRLARTESVTRDLGVQCQPHIGRRLLKISKLKKNRLLFGKFWALGLLSESIYIQTKVLYLDQILL